MKEGIEGGPSEEAIEEKETAGEKACHLFLHQIMVKAISPRTDTTRSSGAAINRG